MISILYVDDEPALLELCRIFLEQTGEFRVGTAESGRDALALLAHEHYDAIVADYQMPEMDGIKLLKAIRAGAGDVPFILFTGRGREEVVIEALNNGADFYLQKGGDPRSQFAELMHKIKQAVSKRRAENKLRESEKRLTDIINFLPDATLAIDREGRVIAWNRAIEDLTGIPASQMLGKGDYEYSLPFYGHRRPILIDLVFESNERIARHYSGIVREKDVLIAETDMPRPKGRQLTLMGKASPLYDQSGNIAGAIESIRDITARKTAEDELRAAYNEIFATEEELRDQYDKLRQNEQVLRESEEKYRTLVENSRDIIYIYRDDHFLVINQRGAEITGHSHEDLMHMRIWDLVHPDDAQRLVKSGMARMRGESVPSQFTARIVTKSGQIIPMDFVAVLISYLGKPAVLGIARDVTERENHIREMARKTKTLTIINQIVRTANQKKTVDELLATILASTLELLDYDAGGIYRVDTVLSKARITCSQNLSGEFVREADNLDIHKKPYDTVFIGGNPLFGENYETINPVRARKYHFKSVASIPIMAEDQVIGALNMISSRRSSVSPDERDVLIMIGRELGSAITRMEAEGALQEREAQYRTLVETTGTGYVILDTEGRVTDANPEYVRLSGHHDLSEIVGRSVIEWTAPAEKERNSVAVRECLTRGFTRNFEIDYMDAGGVITPVEINATVITLGGVTRIVTLCRDITRINKAKEALRESEREYRSIIENMQDMFYRTDLKGKITMISPAGARLIGYHSPEEMIGLDMASDLYDDARERRKFLARIARYGFVTSYPLVFRARDGQRIYVSASSHNYHDATGKIVGVEGIVHDLTYLRQAEDALKEASRKMNILSSITRHDIINQLTVLYGYSQLAMMKNEDPVIGDFLKKIDSVTTTIGQQIEFSKGYQELGMQAPGWSRLSDIITRTRPKEILFSNACPDIEIFADPMLEKVFANLFGNSVMHGERVSQITIGCTPAGDDLVLTVEDNGVGIPLNEKQKIFNKGYGKHTGFGLFLSREILGITGISIHETGKYGSGVRFEITVPKNGFRPFGDNPGPDTF